MASVLKVGSRGQAVRELQTLLNVALPPAGRVRVDGQFGPATEKALRTYQETAGLVVDGIAGRQSLTALRRQAEPIKPARAEPVKAAINAPPFPGVVGDYDAVPPPNNVELLGTARPIDTIWIHCAATPKGKNYTVADIRSWHKQRGWRDIGYHYVVYRDGSIHVGRPIGQVGAHVENHNTGSIGIVYVGGLSADGKRAEDTRTPEQRASLLWLTRQLARKFNVKRIRGHNEVAAKACPSFIVANDPLGRII